MQPWLGSADEQKHGWDYCLSIVGKNSVCKDLCAGCCKSPPRGLHPHHQFSVPVRFQWLGPRFPWNPSGTRSEEGLSQNNLQCWWSLITHLGSLFPLEELEAQGWSLHEVQCCPGGGSMQSTCSPFSYLSNAICHSLCGSGSTCASPPYSRILPVVFCSSTEVILLMRGSEVRDDLHCHPGCITLRASGIKSRS